MSAAALFAPLAPRNREDAARPAPAELPTMYSAGAEIYAQGDRADRLYRVAFGAVRVYRLLADGRRQICAFYLPGEVFGFEVDGRHHFFAEAACASGIAAIRQVSSDEASREHLESALRSLVRAQEHLLVVGRQNALERIAAFLVDMAERQGDLAQFDLPMSRSDIGDYLGLTIETVSRVFSKLRAQGVIRLLGIRSVEMAKPGVLRALCE
ncbi:MAG: helix-turn-helix domain-containing protein [Rhizobiaceae bacterium]|jgi:CRP/FNR family nitrogen fixation transcriptional regulator|nr:helix-turn-helix domain-containing protein [Rhizobiaceae bacterium]